jgi:hypothetical protein
MTGLQMDAQDLADFICQHLERFPKDLLPELSGKTLNLLETIGLERRAMSKGEPVLGMTRPPRAQGKPQLRVVGGSAA